MESNTLKILLIIVVVAMLGAAVYVKNKYKRPVDYRALFWIGLSWVAIGLAIDNYIFAGAGILFMILGLRNKKKWEENRVRWFNLSKEEKRIKVFFLSVILVGVSVFFLTNQNLLGWP